MRSVSVRLADLDRVKINLGFAGENEHTHVLFDCKKAFDQYPNATPFLIVTPPRGDIYPAVVTRDGDIVEWVVTDSDLIYHGNGKVQLQFKQGDIIMKSYEAMTSIAKSSEPTGTVPTPIQNWITQANAILASIPDDIAAALAEAKASGQFDGVGIASIAYKSTSGLVDTYTITLTDGSTYDFAVTNGMPGQNGVGIQSIAKTSTVGLVDTYTVTLTNGQTYPFTVTNGQNGVEIDDTTPANNKVFSSAKVDQELTGVKNAIQGLDGTVEEIKKGTSVVTDSPFTERETANGYKITDGTAKITFIHGSSIIDEDEHSIAYFTASSLVSKDADGNTVDTLSLPISTYFPNGMRSAGSVYDELTSEKAIERIKEKRIGDFTWTYITSGSLAPYFAVYATDGKPSTTTGVPDIISNRYKTVRRRIDEFADGCITLDYDASNCIILIKDLNYSDAASFKAARANDIVCYQLKTTVETSISIDLSYNAVNGGTEVVSGNSLGMSAEIVYPANFAEQIAELTEEQANTSGNVADVKTDVNNIERAIVGNIYTTFVSRETADGSSIKNGKAVIKSIHGKSVVDSGTLKNFTASSIVSKDINGDTIDTLELPISTYFPNGMMSAGNVFDELTENEAISRITSKRVGDLTWTYITNSSVSPYFVAYITDGKPFTSDTLLNITSDGYTTAKRSQSDFVDGTIVGETNETYTIIEIKDLSYNDAAAFKTAKADTVILYERKLVVKTDVSLDMSYKVNADGTEEVVGSNGVPLTGSIAYPINFDNALNRLNDVADRTQAYRGLKTLYMGDSITAMRAWQPSFEKILDITNPISTAVSGATLTDKDNTIYDGDPKYSDDTNNTVPNQLQKIKNAIENSDPDYDDFDLIMIAAGTNDTITRFVDDDVYDHFYSGTTPVSIGNPPYTNHIDAMRYLAEELHTLYPTAEIFFCTPIQGSPSVVNTGNVLEKGTKIKEMCRWLPAHPVDTEDCGIYCFLDTSDLVDSIHPNSQGGTKMGIYNASVVLPIMNAKRVNSKELLE